MSRVKKISKVTIFIVFLVIIISTIGNIVRFKFLSFDSSRLDATDMYYDQPENTIEVVFVGTSVVLNGFSPLDLYDMYGICAYNFGTPGQATMTSYYWVEDTYRNHEESLAAVVFDVSYLRTIPADARYQLPAQKLDMSMTKMNLIKDSADTIDDFMNLISYTFSYHTRWKELVSADFGVGVSDIINTRGYEYYSYKMINGTTYDQINTANYFLEEVEEETVLPEEALFYLDKLVSFCEEASIDLILVKTPADGWEDGDHLAIQSIADEYNLEFIDFNYSDYFEALEFNFATDTIYGIHANYYGASKLTSYLGEYLVNNSNVTDVRNQEGFIFMDEELEEYKRNIVKMDLEEIIDPIEYISYISSKENYTLYMLLLLY